jgi:hypothetical protein
MQVEIVSRATAQIATTRRWYDGRLDHTALVLTTIGACFLDHVLTSPCKCATADLLHNRSAVIQMD